jgi:hypothetical protein
MLSKLSVSAKGGNNPGNKTRGLYYQKHKTYIDKQKSESINIRKFNTLMLNMGYVQTRHRGDKVWHNNDD